MVPTTPEQGLLTHLADVVVLVGEQGTISYISPSCRRLGLDPARLIGASPFEAIHPDDLERARYNVREQLAGRVPPGHREFRLIADDGRTIWVEGNPSVLFDSSGEAIGFVTVLRDITLRRAMEASRETSLVRSAAIARLNHEIRTPLYGLTANLDLLLRQPLSPEAHRLARDMAESADSLSQVLLEILQELEPPIRQGPAAETPPHLPPPERRLSVLAVDDHPINLRLIEAILGDMAEVTCAPDGAAAVAAAADKRFDLILMDVQMPVMDGLEAVRRLRTGAGPNARTPIVMLTANSSPSDIAESRAAGADRHVTKPISPDRLAEVVRQACETAPAA